MTNKELTVTGKFVDRFRRIEIEFADHLYRMLSPFGEDILEVTVKKFYRNRSSAQNRWMWGVCIPTIMSWNKETTGSTPSKEAMYAYLRAGVVGHEMVIEIVNGMDIPVIKGKRFSKMTTVEFSEAVEKIVEHYAGLGLEIPLPKEGTNNLISDYLKDD